MINCVYCGGAHERPADVKQCWSETRAAGGTPTGAVSTASPAAPPSPSEPAPGPADTAAVLLRRGPAVLGRHVIITSAADAPAEWRDAERLVVDDAVLAAPDEAIATLQSATEGRRGLVIELATSFDRVPDAVDARAPHEIGVDHAATEAFRLERLRELVRSNAIDARDPDHPRWHLVDAALAAGASIGGAGDVVAPDGAELWLDGGPVRHHDPIGGVAVLHAVGVEHGSLATPRPNVVADDGALATDQTAAVTHPGGSARIIAPAGSGKTRVLTERARQLVDRWRLPATAVCLVAFNKRAQLEMVERTRDLAGLHVRTLNSIALAIINGAPPFAPQRRTWRTIDEPDVRRLLQRFVATPRRRNTDPLAPWIEALGLVRLGLVDPVEVEARYAGDVAGLADVLPHYEAALAGEGAVDFDGQIDRALRVLLTDVDARCAAQRVCRVLLVDEFQDLTPAHLMLVRLLAGPGGAVFGVGDDDQTIYGYNGADPGWLIDFDRWFPGAGDHPLEVNYRCPAGVVEVADRLLRHNRRRVDKVIRAASSGDDGWHVGHGDDPVAASVGAVQRALGSGAASSDVAVLTRVNATLAPVQVALSGLGIPVAGGVGLEFLERTAVRSSLAWLRLALGGRFASSDLAEALRRPSRSLHPRIAEWVGEQHDVDGLLRLADRLTNERDAGHLGEFAGDIARLQALVAGGANTRRLVDALVDDIGLGGAVATLDHSRRGMNRGAQGDDLLALRQLAALHDDPASFGAWLRDRLSVARSADGVTLATVHRVKGQEWPFVVVHLAADEQYPHRLADDHEEERRLFHVAITRAARHMTLVPGPSPSPFVDELITEPPEHPPEPPQPAPPVRSRRPSRETPDHPLLDRSRVMAAVGLVLVDQGQEWTVVELEPTSALTRRGDATRSFPLGAKVETQGRQRGELGPRAGEVEPAGVVAFDLLRQFRDRARNGKPAYTVFDDKTLAAIATALPASLDELARVRGVGPAKLEQYGDSVLGVVTDALAAAAV